MKPKYLLIAVIIMLASCADRMANIRGRIAAHDEQMVWLDLVSPTGTRTVDSVAVGKTGAFRLEVELPGGQTAIHHLRHDGGTIPLILAPGERVRIEVGEEPGSYAIEGSEGSLRMQELSRIMAGGASTLDSLSKAYQSADPGQQELRRQLERDYTKQYHRTKQEQLRFIASHPHSLAAFYALYQRLPTERALIDGRSDVLYYRMVADSLGQAEPGSPYLDPLKKEIAAFEQNEQMRQLLLEKQQTDGSGFPDIELPDMYGGKVRLSSLKGKVVLLDFWVAADPRFRSRNAEMKEVYPPLHARGFEIYQVSLDTSKPLWVTTVQDQKLPWISVSDLKGPDGYAARIYNVQHIPANYLIDRQGNIVGRDLSGDALVSRVKELL